MSTRGPTFVSSRQRRRAERRRRRAAWVVRLLVVGAAFALGIALGQALGDNPRPGGARTLVRTVQPLPLPAQTRTVTVTTGAAP